MSALRVDLPVVPNATASHGGLGPADLRAAYKPRVCGREPRQGPDGRARRRVRRPDDRVGPEHVPRVLRHPAVHDRERLLQEGQPGRRAGELPASRTRTGSRRSRSTPRWCRRSARTATSCSSRRTRPTRRSPCRTRCSTSDLGAAVDTAVNLGATEVSNSYGSGGAGARPDLLRPLLRPSRRRDHGFGRRPGLRDGLARRVALRDRGRRHRARPGSDDGARLERERLGERPPRHRAERRAGDGQRLLALGAEAGVAARRGLLRAARSPTCRRSRTTSRSTTRRRRSAAGASSRERASARRSSRASTRSPATRSRWSTAPIRTATSRASTTSRTGSNFTPDTVCGYLCTAEPGYDGPTGLGTPNGIGGF